jgi:hypothetical protein
MRKVKLYNPFVILSKIESVPLTASLLVSIIVIALMTLVLIVIYAGPVFLFATILLAAILRVLYAILKGK